MKKIFKGEHHSVWEYLLHLGPSTAAVLLNVISAVLVAVAMWFVKWFTHR